MKLIVDDNIKANYPDLRIGLIIARNIDNEGYSEVLSSLIDDKTAFLCKNFTIESLRENPMIVAWRNTYQSFGVNPKKNTPTAESLLTRLLKGKQVGHISKIVDAYLLVEIEYLLPIGGYDLDNIIGDIRLRYSEGHEEFMSIGSITEEFTNKGEIVYADDNKILTRMWNFRDCEFSKIDKSSKNIVLMTEAADAIIGSEQIMKSLERLAEYIKRFCGGEIDILMADIKESSEFLLK